MNKWICLGERFPEIASNNNTINNSEIVLASDKLGFRYLGYFRRYRYDNYTEFVCVDLECPFDEKEPANVIDATDITHWIPLPERREISNGNY